MELRKADRAVGVMENLSKFSFFKPLHLLIRTCQENCELGGTDNVDGQISAHIFKVRLRLLCLFSFK